MADFSTLGEQADVLQPIDPLSNINIYYASPGAYYILADTGYIKVNRDSVESRLVNAGIKGISNALIKLEDNYNISFAGELAGWRQGVQEQFKDTFGRILITREFKMIEPRGSGDPREWPTIHTILTNLFSDDPVQLLYFDSLIKMSRETLLSGSMDKGPALAIVGPADCGKTFVVNQIMKPTLGGRVANPHEHFSDRTTFNEDLSRAELLVMDDKGSTDFASRTLLADGIKTVCADENARVHPKGKAALSQQLFQRLVILDRQRLEVDTSSALLERL